MLRTVAAALVYCMVGAAMGQRGILFKLMSAALNVTNEQKMGITASGGGAGSTMGVLLLGFHGATLKHLEPNAAIYERILPTWRVVALAANGFGPLRHDLVDGLLL